MWIYKFENICELFEQEIGDFSRQTFLSPSAFVCGLEPWWVEEVTRKSAKGRIGFVHWAARSARPPRYASHSSMVVRSFAAGIPSIAYYASWI